MVEPTKGEAMTQRSVRRTSTTPGGHPASRARPRRGVVVALALGAVAAVAMTGCGPSVGSDPGTSTDRSGVLQAPDDASASGEITIWDRSGDLFKVFDATIADFNKVYPDIKVNHVAIDVDAKLQNT